MLQEDGTLIKIWNRIADLVGLNLLAVLFCIPVVTAGASITAVYGCVFRMKEKRDGYLVKEFWKSFKGSFKASTLIFLGSVLIFIMLCMDHSIFAASGMPESFQILVYAAGIVVVEILTYALPMESYFENPVRVTVKNAVLLGISNLPYTLVMMILNIIPFVIIAKFPVTFGVWFLIGISGTAWINSYFLKKIFTKVKIRKDI